MGIFDNLQTMAEVNAVRRARPKGLPAVIERKQRKATKADAEREFRDKVRARDGHKSRASGVPVSPTAMDWDQRAEVHHRLKRSTNPEERLNVANGITLTKTEHKLAETRCPNCIEHYMLEITGPDDLGKPQTVTTRDIHGKVIKRTRG